MEKLLFILLSSAVLAACDVEKRAEPLQERMEQNFTRPTESEACKEPNSDDPRCKNATDGQN